MTKIPVKHWKKDEDVYDHAKESLYTPCFGVVWEKASPEVTKAQILADVEKLHKSLKARGIKYCRELVKAIILSHLDMYAFTTKETDSLATIFDKFESWWSLPLERRKKWKESFRHEAMMQYFRWLDQRDLKRTLRDMKRSPLPRSS